MSSTSYDADDIAARISREEQAAARARCDRSRQAHLGLADAYRSMMTVMALVQGNMTQVAGSRR